MDCTGICDIEPYIEDGDDAVGGGVGVGGGAPHVWLCKFLLHFFDFVIYLPATEPKNNQQPQTN